MALELRRGSVVGCGRRLFVVWQVHEETREATCFVVRSVRHRRRHQVEIPALEGTAVGVRTGEVIEAWQPRKLQLADLKHRGELVGTTICTLVRAVIACDADDRIANKWAAEKAHAYEALDLQFGIARRAGQLDDVEEPQ